jgi:hypothetical protein
LTRPRSFRDDLRKHQWGRSDLNRRPTDYECDRIPHEGPRIGRFVLGCLTLADLADQHFSPSCATNVPHELSGSLSLLGPRRLVRSEASSMADGARIDRGEWHLEADVPSAEDAVDVRVLQDDGGCYSGTMGAPLRPDRRGTKPTDLSETGRRSARVFEHGTRIVTDSSAGAITPQLVVAMSPLPCVRGMQPLPCDCRSRRRRSVSTCSSTDRRQR